MKLDLPTEILAAHRAGKVRDVPVTELEIPQLGGLSIDPERADDVRLVATANRLECEADQSRPRPVAGPEAEAVVVQKLIGEQNARVGRVIDGLVADLPHEPVR